jgi:hypothetical protein
VAASPISKAYGQTYTFTGTEFTSSGLQNGETIGSLALASLGAAATANVAGSPYPITAGNATGGTFTASNYAISYSPGVMTVIPAGLTITADNAAKTYGQTTTFAGTEFTSSGLQNGQTVGTVTLASPGAAASAGAAGSTYAITASNVAGGTFNPANYSITYDPGQLTVNQAPLTVTAGSAAKTYGQTATFAGSDFTSSGLQNGEVIGSVFLSSAGAAPTAGVTGSPYAINASTAAGGTFNPANYSITYDPGQLTVSPAVLAITADNASKTYGQALGATSGAFTSSGLQNGETIGSVVLASPGGVPTAGVAGSPYSLAPSNAAGGSFNPANYLITYNPAQLTVDPAAVTVTADNRVKIYGQAYAFAGTEFTSSGLQNGETIGSVSLSSAGAPATANVLGSPYAIAISTAAGGTFNPANYTITYAPGLFTVNPMTLNLTITADDLSKTYGQTLAFTGGEFTSVGLKNGDSIRSVTLSSAGAAATANVGAYPILAASATGSFTPSDYIITYDPGTLTVNPAALTIAANSLTKTYGQAYPFAGTEFTSRGLENGETIGWVNLASPGAAPTAGVTGSPYVIAAGGASGGTFSPSNYTITFEAGSLSVSPATLTVTATPATGTVGSSLPAFGGAVTGFVGGDTLAGATAGTLAFTTDAAPTSPAGSYAIDGAGLSAANYILVQAPGNAGALTLNNPTNIGTQPIGVGTTTVPIASQGGSALTAADPNGPTAGRSTDASGTPSQTSGRVDASVPVGKFLVVYKAEASGRQAQDELFRLGLSHASSFMIFRDDDRPAFVLKRPGS